MVEAVVAGSISDDLQDEDLVLQQLEQLPIICRCVAWLRACVRVARCSRCCRRCRYKYALLAKQVLGILDPLLNRLNEGLSLLHTSHDATVAAKITVIEGACRVVPCRGFCGCVAPVAHVGPRLLSPPSQARLDCVLHWRHHRRSRVVRGPLLARSVARCDCACPDRYIACCRVAVAASYDLATLAASWWTQTCADACCN